MCHVWMERGSGTLRTQQAFTSIEPFGINAVIMYTIYMLKTMTTFFRCRRFLCLLHIGSFDFRSFRFWLSYSVIAMYVHIQSNTHAHALHPLTDTNFGLSLQFWLLSPFDVVRLLLHSNIKCMDVQFYSVMNKYTYKLRWHSLSHSVYVWYAVLLFYWSIECVGAVGWMDGWLVVSFQFR